MKIKICGLRREEDVRAANACGPDYIGYIFCERFRRYVAPERAARLTELLRPEITPVGVFVDQSSKEILRIAESGTIRMIQLHGSEPKEQIRELQSKSGLPVIQAVRAEDRETVLRALSSEADFLLFDSGTGTGRTFDWSLLAGVFRPFFLAGGLTPETIPEAVQSVRAASAGGGTGDADRGVEGADRRLADAECGAGGAVRGAAGESLTFGDAESTPGRCGLYAVDISSGAETDGWKDAGKMQRAVDAARGVCG